MRNQKGYMKKYLMGLGALVFGGAFWACSDFDKTSGTDEQSEGIVALADKKFSGKAQKGPLVKGSTVVLRETSAEGKLEPTGREFETTTTNDSGAFQFGDLDLESQYVLLSAEGYYFHEHDENYYYYQDVGERAEEVFGTLETRSECPMRLDAATNLNNRNTANINLLTHFEYKRVLKLVEEGKTFAEAKKQASMEVLGAFGVEIDAASAEDLDIFNTSEADRTLFNISLLIDDRWVWDFWKSEEEAGMDRWTYYYNNDNVDCSKLQKFIDGFANDFADDGVISDTIMRRLAVSAYGTATEKSHMEYVDEDDMREKEEADPGSYDILVVMKKRYEFSKLLFLHYMDVEACTENLWGEYRKFERPFEYYDYEHDQYVIIDSGYLLCDGFEWVVTTKEHIDSLTMVIEHENGTMTDPRDGREYKTVSFEYEGKRYEWMAEDLKYNVAPVTHTKGGKSGNREVGVYSWTEAMRLNEGYMTRYVREGLIDSLHQGICPDGWHVSNSLEWMALLRYVGGPENLLDETWRASPEVAFGKGSIGVFHNKFDFNLTPLDKKYLHAYYHTYAPNGAFQPTDQDADEWNRSFFDSEYPLLDSESEFYTVEISIDWDYVSDSEVRREGAVRCVKN